MHTTRKTVLIKSLFAFIIFLIGMLPSTLKAQYEINSEAGNLATCDTMSRGGFIIWWDKDYDFAEQVDVMLDTMTAFRSYCINNIGMQDPLSVLDGYYCNIYIHNPGEPDDYFYENYPDWGNGVGADINGYAFMTLPGFVIYDFRNLAHETFHIFQSHGMWDITPGIYSSDDGGWFVEASADWFATYRYPDDPYSFIGVEILVRIPEVPIWLDFYNFPADYSYNWQRTVHQYAMGIFFFYLTNHVGINDSTLMSIFYSGTDQLAQKYLYDLLGGENLRDYFIDFAGRLTNDFDFITTEQANKSLIEWNTYAEEDDDHQFIQTYNDAGSDGWFRPEEDVATNAWSFNTYKLNNSSTENYTFEINGDETGVYGDAAYFQGQVVVINAVTGTTFHNLDMMNDFEGSLTLSLTPDDTEIYFIIASMPEVFEDTHADFQLFPYEMRITKGDVNAIAEINPSSTKYEVGRYNLLGERINDNTNGMQIIKFNDGSSQKVFVGH